MIYHQLENEQYKLDDSKSSQEFQIHGIIKIIKSDGQSVIIFQKEYQNIGILWKDETFKRSFNYYFQYQHITNLTR